MKTRIVLLSFFGLVVLLATGGAVCENYEMRNANGALSRALHQSGEQQRELTKAKVAVNEAERAAEKAEQQRDALKKQIDELLAAQSTSMAKASSAAPATAKTAASVFNRLIATNPEYQKQNLQYGRLRDGVSFARLYRRLALSPRQIETFEEARFARQQVEYDIMAVAFEKEISQTDTSFRPIRKQADAECEAKLREALGDAGYAAYKAYPKEMMTSSRNEARQLAAALYETKEPLTVEQADALTCVIDANSNFQKNAPLQTNWEAVVVQAQGILSEPQLMELKRNNETQRLLRLMYEISNKAAKARQ
jgi:hypothetical protein